VTEIALLLIAPLVGILYSVGEYFGIWDKLTGRDKAIEGLSRLRSGAGFPKSFIYDDPQDKVIFEALFRRIRRHSLSQDLRAALEKEKPSMIAPVGAPFHIQGVPQDWPQDRRAFYSENHYVLVGFGAHREGSGGSGKRGVAYPACSLKDLDDWLKEEESKRKFYVGTLMVAILSTSVILLRACMAGKP